MTTTTTRRTTKIIIIISNNYDDDDGNNNNNNNNNNKNKNKKNKKMKNNNNNNNITTATTITMTITIFIVLKDANRDFHNLLTAPRTVSYTHAQVARAQSRAAHKAFITYNMPCATWYKGTYQPINRWLSTEQQGFFFLLTLSTVEIEANHQEMCRAEDRPQRPTYSSRRQSQGEAPCNRGSCQLWLS